MKKIVWLCFLLLLACLSYLREVLFISINAVIAGESYFYAKSTEIEFFLEKSVETLIQYKYAMTIGFTIAFALLTILGLRLSFKNKLAFYFGIIIYSICLFIAVLLILYSIATNSFNSVYSSLRLIIEYLHNPLIYIILSASYLGFNFSKKRTLE